MLDTLELPEKEGGGYICPSCGQTMQYVYVRTITYSTHRFDLLSAESDSHHDRDWEISGVECPHCHDDLPGDHAAVTMAESYL